MNKGWKKLFEQGIRARGKEYASYAVHDYAETEDGYSAMVSGKERYSVVISSDCENMSCTCPYAKDGKRCKHMAAVLYYAELLEKQEQESRRKAQEKIKRAELREMIWHVIKEFGKEDVSSFCADVQPVSEWKKEINDLIKEFKNKDGNIGYWEADDFVYNLLDYFKNLYALVTICEDRKAIAASFWLYKRIHDIYVDDSSTGCMWHFENEMLALWTEIAEYSDKNKELLKTTLSSYDHHYDALEEMLDKLKNG